MRGVICKKRVSHLRETPGAGPAIIDGVRSTLQAGSAHSPGGRPRLPGVGASSAPARPSCNPSLRPGYTRHWDPRGETLRKERQYY